MLGYLEKCSPSSTNLKRDLLGNIPDLGSHALHEDAHANLPVGIVLAGKHRDLTKTCHSRQIVFEPVRVMKTLTKL